MADNLNNKNLELLAELKGGASLSGASGKRIMNQLKSIMREIQAKKVTSLQLDIDTSPQVQAKMQAQVNTLAKSLSADVKLNIQANGSKNFSQLSLSSSENTYNQALTQTAKTITNIHTPALQTLEIQAEETGEAVQSAGNKINQMFRQKLGNQLVSVGLDTIKNAVVSIYQNVIDLDSAIAKLQLTTGYSKSQTKALTAEYNSLAKQLGVTTATVVSTANTWLSQGYSVEETNQLIQNSILLARLGQMETAEAVSTLAGIMKGYNQTIGESVKIVDKLTAVDQQAAASAGEIAYAISISADSAQAAGVNINRLVGYLAAIREVTQGSTESIGIFADTLFTRIVNLQNKSLTGRSVPDDLSEIERILSNVGITLREADTSAFRDFGTILDEINVKWNTFTLGQQQTIATAFAGADQQEYFTALMEHYGTALNYAAAATNSAGAALNQYQQTYLTSAEAAQNRLTDSFERLSTTILNSEVITGVFDTGTGILSFLTQVIDWLGMIPTLAGTAAAALSFKNIGRHNRQNMPVYAPLTFADFAACA